MLFAIQIKLSVFKGSTAEDINKWRQNLCNNNKTKILHSSKCRLTVVLVSSKQLEAILHKF
jgi:hypothetical protein